MQKKHAGMPELYVLQILRYMLPFRESLDFRTRRRILKERLSPVSTALRNLSMAYSALSSSVADLKKKLEDVDSYWKSVYGRCSELMEAGRVLAVKKADTEKQLALQRRESEHMETIYKEAEKENRYLRRENAYLRQMMEKYLYPDLARQLMSEAHLPVQRSGNTTKAALAEMIEGNRPLSFDGAQKGKARTKSKAEQLLDEMRRQAGE